MKNVQTTLKTLSSDMKTFGMETTNPPLEAVDRFLNHKLDTDLTTSFWDDNTTVSSSFDDVLNKAREMAKNTKDKGVGENAQRALGLLVGKQMLDNLQEEEDKWLHSIVLLAVLKQYRTWSIKNKEGKFRGTIIRRDFQQVAGKDSFMDDKLEEALDYYKGFSFEMEEGFVLKSVTEKATGKNYPVIDSDVSVYISSTGLRISVPKGKTIKPMRGQVFKFKHGTQITLDTTVVNGKLKDVLQMIRIHNVREEYIDIKINDEKREVYTKAPYRFKPEDALVLAVLLKINNINLKELFTHKAQDQHKLLVLARKESETNPRSLYPVVCPAHTFPEAYGVCGVLSSTDASSGFYTKMVTVPRLVEFEEETGLVYTRENVGKVIARFDKLNNSKAIWIRKLKVFVCADVVWSPILSAALAGGNLLVPNSVIESDGACRVVSDMDHGGIKASYTPFKGVDSELAKGDVCLIGANGFKGGMLSAVGLTLGRTDYLASLKPIVAAEAIIRALNPNKGLPQNLLDAEEESSEMLNQITDQLVKSLTTIVVNGQKVRGVLVEIEVKVTNTYTLDRLQFAEEEEKDEDEGSQAIEEAEASIKKLQNQLQYGTVSTNGLRAFVAEKKSQDPDDFNVSRWVDEGLKDKTLKRKSLHTRVIMQELQSIESWYGKEVAMNFFNELLSAQQDRGFNVNKLYATQFIGFFEKPILNTIKAVDLAVILFESKKGAVHENSIYFKETMKEILDLISVHNDMGWLTVEYVGGSVDIPMGDVFTGDTVCQMTNDKSYVVAKGLLADLLENVKSLLNEDGTTRPSANNHLLMEAMVQRPLLGKNFGYQFAKGYYGVALPLVGNYGPTVVGVTNRDRLIKSDNRFVPMAVSKAPQYFKGMTSSYNVLEMNFGYYMDLMLESAIFMYTETFLAFLNDFDGDLARITVQGGETLPSATLNYKEFNGNFFKLGHDAEVEGNYLKINKARAATLSDYHKAVFESVTAKNNVGMYTANSYFYEAMCPNMVGETIMDIHSNEVIVTKDLCYRLNSILKMLIQVEAMDNVKQEGSKTFLSELFFNWSIRSLMERRTEEQQDKHFKELFEGVMSLVRSYDIDTDSVEVSAMIGLAKETAVRFNKENTTAFNLFNARNINEKNKENIMKFIIGEDDILNEMLNFRDKAEEIVNGLDQNSMYQQVILDTAKALEDCNFNIYVGDQG